jgi:hypothetical protein
VEYLVNAMQIIKIILSLSSKFKLKYFLWINSYELKYAINNNIFFD